MKTVQNIALKTFLLDLMDFSEFGFGFWSCNLRAGASLTQPVQIDGSSY